MSREDMPACTEDNIDTMDGEMAERSNVLPWKGSMREIASGVRIPLSPQRGKRSLTSAGEEAMRLRASRGGFEKAEHVARSAASTMRSLYRSCKLRIPLSTE